MEYNQNDDFNNMSLTKFESMLKTNNVLFFDSNEFENIIHHYLENGKVSLAKKAIKLGLQQHPTSTNLRLFKIEILVIANKFEDANELLDELYILEPNNDEIYIQKANVLSKSTVKTIIYLSCNPESFARDAKLILHHNRYQLKEITPIDQFYWSHHIELLGVFELV